MLGIENKLPEASSDFLIGMDCFKVQLPMVHEMIKTAYDGSAISVTSVRTIADAYV